MNDKGWSMEELARAAGVSSQTVRKAERGIRVSELSMARIAKALGLSVARLFPDES
jgi:transcriptional regulator with XRE-family HTH domain